MEGDGHPTEQAFHLSEAWLHIPGQSTGPGLKLGQLGVTGCERGSLLVHQQLQADQTSCRSRGWYELFPDPVHGHHEHHNGAVEGTVECL